MRTAHTQLEELRELHTQQPQEQRLVAAADSDAASAPASPAATAAAPNDAVESGGEPDDLDDQSPPRDAIAAAESDQAADDENIDDFEDKDNDEDEDRTPEAPALTNAASGDASASPGTGAPPAEYVVPPERLLPLASAPAPPAEDAAHTSYDTPKPSPKAAKARRGGTRKRQRAPTRSPPADDAAAERKGNEGDARLDADDVVLTTVRRLQLDGAALRTVLRHAGLPVDPGATLGGDALDVVRAGVVGRLVRNVVPAPSGKGSVGRVSDVVGVEITDDKNGVTALLRVEHGGRTRTIKPSQVSSAPFTAEEVAAWRRTASAPSPKVLAQRAWEVMTPQSPGSAERTPRPWC